MRGLILLTAAAGGIFIIIVAAISFLYPLGKAPLKIHSWFPFPAACAGYSCATYPQWAKAAGFSVDPAVGEKTLNSLLEIKAAKAVARYEGVRVSSGEKKQALEVIKETVARVPAVETKLNELYGGSFEKGMEKSIHFLLLQEKLINAGISSPWESEYAPTVTVWNKNLRWDKQKKQVVYKR